MHLQECDPKRLFPLILHSLD